MKKIIVTGKGGVGKTTTVATLALMMARDGKRVIVFDTDPSMNLAMSFGVPYAGLPTITQDKVEIFHDLEDGGIEECGDQIIAEHSVVTGDGVRIVIMGAIQEGGDGCLCSAVSMVKVLIGYLEGAGGYDVVIVDSQAGPEILGRGLASRFDANVILSEPTAKSYEVSRQVRKLGEDLGIRETVLLVNKSDHGSDADAAAGALGIDPAKTVGIPFDKDVVKSDRDGKLLIDAYPKSAALGMLREAKAVVERAIGW